MSVVTIPAPATIQTAGERARPAEGFWIGALRRLRRHRLAFASSMFIAALFAAAFLGPLVVDGSYATQDMGNTLARPGAGAWLGTDTLGRDVLIRLMYGARISLTVGIVVQAVIVIIGVPAGLLAGYAGGKTDMVIMRLVDVLYALPNLLFVILIMTFLRSKLADNPSGVTKLIATVDGKSGGLIGVYIGLGLISWLTVARIVRATTMSLKEKEYVEAARGLGASDTRIMMRHLLPNTVAPIVVAATLGIPGAILYEAGISFLGLGVLPPMPSWGLMISDAIPQMRSHPHLLISPAILLSLTVLAFNFVGDGLRDALDPWMDR